MAELSTEEPLAPLLSEINQAARSGMALLAVTMTMTLPDICSSLATEDGWTTRDLYKKWCEENLPEEEFGVLTPDDLYSFRCGVLHKGRFGDLQHNVDRVIFALPGRFTFTNCTLNDAYFYSVTIFCRNFTDAVAKWFEKHRDDPVVKANLPRLMQYRVNGLPPYIEGATVLA